MSSSPSNKTVALVDPLWFGHHPMYFSQFTSAFLRLGCTVAGMCPEPAEAMQSARAAATGRIRDFDHRVSMSYLPADKPSFFGNRFGGDPLRTWQRWKKLADSLYDVEQGLGRKVDLVFFPFLDNYLRLLPLSSVPQLTIARPWSGLYLRNHHHGRTDGPLKPLVLLGKGDALMRSRLCPGIGVLDERFIPPMERYTGRPVHAFPDVTDASLPERPYGLADEIRRKAAGRKIIGLIGLERRKGVLNLLRVAEKARELRLPWYFVCAGSFDKSDYSAPEQALLAGTAEQVTSGGIDNLHFEPRAARIPAEADFNSVFSTFDLAWVAYEGFEGSSGALGKAAAFDIPCIATSGECIGRRVEHYGTGLTIPEGDSGRALEAIRRVLDGKDWQDRPLAAEHWRYREDHGLPRLDALLSGILKGL